MTEFPLKRPSIIPTLTPFGTNRSCKLFTEAKMRKLRAKPLKMTTFWMKVNKHVDEEAKCLYFCVILPDNERNF